MQFCKRRENVHVTNWMFVELKLHDSLSHVEQHKVLNRTTVKILGSFSSLAPFATTTLMIPLGFHSLRT